MILKPGDCYKPEPEVSKCLEEEPKTQGNQVLGHLPDLHSDTGKRQRKLNSKTGEESTIFKMGKKDNFNYLEVEQHKHYQRTSRFKQEMAQYCCFDEILAEHEHCIFGQNVEFDVTNWNDMNN